MIKRLNFNLISFLIVIAGINSIFGMQLSKFNFNAASVLPIGKTASGNVVVVLGREAFGPDKGTWDAFGGKREQIENHPVMTASREFTEETGGLFITNKKEALKYIDIDTGNTQYIIANENKKSVIYITNFGFNKVQNFFNKFYYSKTDNEKDLIAQVNWDDLAKAIRNANRDAGGQLILPVTVFANVAKPYKNALGKNTWQMNKQKISLRPYFVSTLQTFFKDLDTGKKNYTAGKNDKIRFYKR